MITIFNKWVKNKNTDDIEIGDYVICGENTISDEDVKSFTSNNIGQYIRRPNILNGDVIIEDCDYLIQYKKIPKGLKKDFKYSKSSKNTRIMSREDIKYHNPDKKELEIYLSINKYNI